MVTYYTILWYKLVLMLGINFNYPLIPNIYVFFWVFFAFLRLFQGFVVHCVLVWSEITFSFFFLSIPFSFLIVNFQMSFANSLHLMLSFGNFSVTQLLKLIFFSGAGTTGGRAGGDDQTASLPVHHPSTWDRHVQPKCKCNVCCLLQAAGSIHQGVIHSSIHPSVLFHLSNSGSIPASIGQVVGWPHSYGSYNTYERWTHLYSTSCDLCFPNKLYLGSGLGPLLGLFYYLGSNSLIV